MEATSRHSLRIVPLDMVRAHEIADPARETRIRTRLGEDGILRDPLMVGTLTAMDGFVLLDGTNRRQALLALGLSTALVQVIDYADENAVQLRTWCHQARVDIDVLLHACAHLSGIEVLPLSPLGATDALRAAGTLAVLLTSGRQVALMRSQHEGTGRVEQLRALVDLYEDRMERTDCDPESIEERAQTIPSNETLVAFPAFARSQVVSMAMRDIRIPAGITRHVVLCGRALRVNVPLDLLSGEYTSQDANEALARHIDVLRPRYYREATILFDS